MSALPPPGRQPGPPPPPWRGMLAAIIVILALVGGVALVDDDNDGKPDHVTVKLPIAASSPAIPSTVPVDTADPDNKPDTPLRLTETAQRVAQTYVNDPKDLSNAGPVPLSGPGVQKHIGEVPYPMAADEIAGCRTRFLHTNFSARTVALARVVIFELHYTAGPDLPGSRADVDGLTAFGDRSSSRVSWHFNMDKDGNCDYNVPLRSKAWTIAGLNSYTINVEVAGHGEAPYLRPAGYRKLASIIQQVHQAYPAITLQMAESSNCVPTKAGIGTHWKGGPCSGGHVDIKPLDLAAVIAQIKAYTAPQYPPITARQRARCHELNGIRRRAARTGKWRPRGRANAIRAGEREHHLRCRLKPPAGERHLVRR